MVSTLSLPGRAGFVVFKAKKFEFLSPCVFRLRVRGEAARGPSRQPPRGGCKCAGEAPKTIASVFLRLKNFVYLFIILSTSSGSLDSVVCGSPVTSPPRLCVLVNRFP